MAGSGSDLLTIRVPRDLFRKLSREARRSGRSPSAVARSILVKALWRTDDATSEVEARRQSLLARTHESEQEVLRFIGETADLKGWD